MTNTAPVEHLPLDPFNKPKLKLDFSALLRSPRAKTRKDAEGNPLICSAVSYHPVDGDLLCSKEVWSKGLCITHYRQWRRAEAKMNAEREKEGLIPKPLPQSEVDFNFPKEHTPESHR